MEKHLRKRQNMLVDAGIGVVLFAVWSVVRTNLYLGFSSFSVDQVYQAAAQNGISEKFFLIFLITIFVGILIWQLSIRLYIGLSAAAEGKGKSKGWTYLICAFILLISDLKIMWQAFDVGQILTGEGIDVNLITGLCMEAASIYVLLELLISGLLLKKMNIKMKE